jgi:hypothetical protein
MSKRIGVAVAVLSVVALGGLAACGGQSKSLANEGFCSRFGSIERASVTRLITLHNKYAPFEFPARVQITSPARARLLATAICELPRFPSGVVFSCPADLGVIYRVRFGDEGRVSIDPGGCENVTGAGSVRWAARSPRFWPEFGRALGLRGATRATFAGELR